MSSSRRNSPSRRPAREICPICGRRSLARVVEEIALQARGRTYRFDDIPHHKCTACGERLTDFETNRLFDVAVLRPRGRPAAA